MENVTNSNDAVVTPTVESLQAEITKLTGLNEHKERVMAEQRDRAWKYQREQLALRKTVRDFFKEQFDGDKNANITLTLDEVNELLTDIGADELAFTYSATVTISFVVTGVEADDEDDARQKIERAVDWGITSLDHNGIEDEEVEIDNVEAE